MKLWTNWIKYLWTNVSIECSSVWRSALLSESRWTDAHWSGADDRNFRSGTVTGLGVRGLGTNASTVTGFWFWDRGMDSCLTARFWVCSLGVGSSTLTGSCVCIIETDSCIRSETFVNTAGDGGVLGHTLWVLSGTVSSSMISCSKASLGYIHFVCRRASICTQCNWCPTLTRYISQRSQSSYHCTRHPLFFTSTSILHLHGVPRG